MQFENDRRLFALIEAIGDRAWLVDTQYRLIAGNAAFHQEVINAFGRPFAIGENVLSAAMPEAARQQWQNYYTRALNGEAYRIETQTQFTTGIRFLELRFNPIRAADGSCTGVAVIGSDITRRKHTEEKLHASEVELQHTLDTIPNILWTSLPDGHIDYCSQNWLDFTGMTQEQIQGSGWMKALHPDDVAHTGNVWVEACRERKSYEVEQRLRRFDGEYHWFLTRARPTFDETGNILKWYGSNTDITERKLAETRLEDTFIQLAKSLERLDLAARAAALGIWDWDIQKNELVWDDRMYKLYGIQREDFAGAYEAWLAGVHPDDRALSNEISQQARLGEKEYDTEFRIILPTGAIRAIKAYGQVIYDAQGNPTRMIGVNYDITERKRVEEQIRAALAEKEMLLRELNHRTKNNLNIVSSLINLQATTSANEEFHALAQTLTDRIKAIALVHQMLYRVPNLSQVNLEIYLRELVSSLAASFDAAPGKITVEIESMPVLVGINSAIPCGQFMNELLSNAFKYAFPGERKGKIHIQLQQTQDGEIILRVRDDGVGLPHDYNEEDSDSLGMAILRMLAQQLNGQLNIQNGSGVAYELRFKEAN